MTDAAGRYKEVLQGLKDWGAKMVVYVPDRWIGPICQAAEADPDLISVNACREEEGVAICVGALVAGGVEASATVGPANARACSDDYALGHVLV